MNLLARARAAARCPAAQVVKGAAENINAKNSQYGNMSGRRSAGGAVQNEIFARPSTRDVRNPAKDARARAGREAGMAERETRARAAAPDWVRIRPDKEERGHAGKRIAIVGAGANGAGIGADLTRAGLDVTFIEQWPAHVEAMRKNGVRVETPDETLVTPVRAFHLCEVAALREAFDIVLIVVKAYDTRWACELIKPLVRPDGLVVGLQNGMTMDDIATIVGPERTLGAVIEVTANMFEPGVVVRQTPPNGSWFAIGAFRRSARGREDEAAQCLGHAGTVEISEDIRSAKWMKLVVNAAEFLPSAILGLPLAEGDRLASAKS